MKHSEERTLTTHAGSLPRPEELIGLYAEKMDGNLRDSEALDACLRASVSTVLADQVNAGIDIVNDGEFGKPTRAATNNAAWGSYIYGRISGFGPAIPGQETPKENPTPPAKIVSIRHEQREFAEYYQETAPGSVTSPPGRSMCIGPIEYTGHAALKADLDNLKAAVVQSGVEEAFVSSIAPGSIEVFSRGQNAYYGTTEEFLAAISRAMQEEYRAIVEAGFILQIDDPGLPDAWDMLEPLPTVEEYRRFALLRVEALNAALESIPEDRVRYHMCWGSWHGPHTTDIPLRDVVDVMLQVKAEAYSIEAANVRHEHEWKVWQDVKLPDGKILIPGVVSHATNVVEHPELVADRIIRYAQHVGRENVIAGTDCGLGGRVHPSIAWAKLRVLSEGASLATSALWK